MPRTAATLEQRKAKLDKLSGDYWESRQTEDGEEEETFLTQRQLASCAYIDKVQNSWATTCFLVQKLDRPTGGWRRPTLLLMRWRWKRAPKGMPDGDGWWVANPGGKLYVSTAAFSTFATFAPSFAQLADHYNRIIDDEKQAAKTARLEAARLVAR